VITGAWIHHPLPSMTDIVLIVTATTTAINFIVTCLILGRINALEYRMDDTSDVVSKMMK